MVAMATPYLQRRMERNDIGSLILRKIECEGFDKALSKVK